MEKEFYVVMVIDAEMNVLSEPECFETVQDMRDGVDRKVEGTVPTLQVVAFKMIPISVTPGTMEQV